MRAQRHHPNWSPERNKLTGTVQRSKGALAAASPASPSALSASTAPR